MGNIKIVKNISKAFHVSVKAVDGNNKTIEHFTNNLCTSYAEARALANTYSTALTKWYIN